jgi:hypothetical protein
MVMRFEFDPHPFARGGSFAIFATSAMHLYQLFLMIASPASIKATCLYALVSVFHLFVRNDNMIVLYILLVASASLSLTGALFRLGWARLLIFLPQHFVLGIMAYGGLIAALEGRYLDGTVMDWSHISADQVGFICLFVVHSSAIVRRCRDPNG